ncbi:hypothetical protein [Shimia ponticola]|uniref:hypothetical protein n=1 Tax=Shimia ponticola TaxID=2582893 RepID=UPI0011BE09FE|nr:hypothetical protein [Shimia ponticola]
MADMTTIAPAHLIPSLWDRALGVWAYLSASLTGTTHPVSDHLARDAGLQKAQELSPLSQDAATALHLMSLGQWY